MTDSLSIREISRRTDVPESTLRYYRSLFPEHIPTHGSGRHRRHPEGAIPVFRLIAGMFASGESRAAVRRELERADGFERLEPTVTTGPQRDDRVAGSACYEIAIAEPARLPSRELEDLLTALLVRDRELASMHRELLEMVGQLIHALGRPATPTAFSEPAIAPPPQPGPVAEAAADPAADSLEIEQLRDSLARERETVERLRRARLELEQRLGRMEREERGGRRR